MNILTTSCLFTFIREGIMYIEFNFIYRSIFTISELRKRRVHVHCAAYHFRIWSIKAIQAMISQLIKTVSHFRFMKTIVTMNIMKRKHLTANLFWFM